MPGSPDPLRVARATAYETDRPEVVALVPRDARRLLDLGCAAGALGAAIKERQPAEVVGIEIDPGYAADAERILDRVICEDADAALAAPDLGLFDCLIAADILEHLVDPWSTLRYAVTLLRPGGTVIVSLPNVRYLLIYWRLIWEGRWPRDPSGFFDATHLRWFTPGDARDLLRQAGLVVEEERPRFFFSGRALQLAERTAGTTAAEFLAGQWVLRGRRI